MATTPTPTSCETSLAQKVIPLAEPVLTGREAEYVRECLETNFVSSVGPFVERFEHLVADVVGAAHGVATVNGTSALHIALLVAGVQPDEEVLVPALSFIAPANAVRYVGAWPVFIDAEPEYWQMDPARVEDFVTRQCTWSRGELRHAATGRRVRAMLPVHALGHPCDVDPLLELANRYGVIVIEDAAESLGARYRDRPVGHLGHLGCFSFNGNKVVTAGGGGMVVTDNAEWAARARVLTTQARQPGPQAVHQEIGYNYRLTNLQAAVGCAQLEQLDKFLDHKRRVAAAYTHAFSRIGGIEPMREASWAFSAYWLYTIAVSSGHPIDQLMQVLAQQGIESRPLWQPLHRSPAHQSHAAQAECPVAEDVAGRALSLPSSANLSEADQRKVIETVKQWIVC